MRVLIAGGAGALGSSFVKLCLDRGYEVTVLDVVREPEAWRLDDLGVRGGVRYVWKATQDLSRRDVEDAGVVVDSAAMADRPMGTTSPSFTLFENIQGPLRLLEVCREIEPKPFLIYPSSLVEFLGVPRNEQPITENTRPKPTSFYGLSKWMAEELYLQYHRTFGIPVLITRTGSAFGPRMREDEFVARCIRSALEGKEIVVKSPRASRAWTFAGDVGRFNELVLKKLEKNRGALDGLVLHNAGSKTSSPLTNLDIAELCHELVGSEPKIAEGGYEEGEKIGGEPVCQLVKSDLSWDVLGWKPQYSVRDALKETIGWFRDRG